MLENVLCPACRQDHMRRMHHKAAPCFAFWMCAECDSVWIDIEDARAGGRNRITLAALYGNHDWPLIDEGFIVPSHKLQGFPMNEKPDEIIDGKIYPREVSPSADRTSEIAGNRWRIWKEELKCFLEFDEEHFATKMVAIEISQSEYDLIASRPSAVSEVIISRQKR